MGPQSDERRAGGLFLFTAHQETDAVPDAEETGDETPTPGETGAEGDAGQQDTGDEGATVDPQEIHDAVWAEARQALNSKDERIKDLESQIEELKERSAPDDEGDDADVVTREQFEEVTTKLREEIESRDSAVQQANEANARNELIKQLRSQGVVKPEVFADTLIAKGRVSADVTKGLDHFEVKTAEGTKMLTDEGKEADVAYLAERWAESNPEFVRDPTQQGAGFREGGDAQPKGYEGRLKEARKQGPDATIGVKFQKAREMRPSGQGD